MTPVTVCIPPAPAVIASITSTTGVSVNERAKILDRPASFNDRITSGVELLKRRLTIASGPGAPVEMIC